MLCKHWPVSYRYIIGKYFATEDILNSEAFGFFRKIILQ
jgi:hypothetical protein